MRARQRQTLETQGEAVGWGGGLSRLRWSLLPSATPALCVRETHQQVGRLGSHSPPSHAGQLLSPGPRTGGH